MKFTPVVAFLFAAAAASVEARPSETNANRMARGLPPMPPTRRATPAQAARRNQPSGVSGSCNTGPVQCCNSVTSANKNLLTVLETLFGLSVPLGTSVGTSCSPLSGVGIGGNSCHQQPVCCENNHFNGLVAIGCSPININL